MEGERIVLSSSFLLDSESRLRPAKSASGTVTDPVCGMEVQTAAAGGNRSSYRGTTYYFCSEKCKRQFDRNPARYLPPPAAVRQRRQTGVPPVIAQSSPVEEEPDREVVASAERQDSASRAVAKNPATTPPATNPLEDPVCGGVVDEAKARAEGRVSQFMGRTYFFSAERCKQEFDKTPLRYAGSTDSPDPETDTGEAPGSAAPARHDSRRTGGKDNPQ